ncbi:MAG TPA: cbb3-type cytochrome c oxidase subunit 3 [Xanthomonadaceae bacterium]|nr:cbb3-type cytochrome c oxidase subunit 3 [Xanthomonadales bacterium]HPF72714.1 cbb3-type cytochrome c oxidase subunit 3 [Xanthomonadaceae bacterium]HRY00163.1 cbb3-type cytochrome c oxidase subunit 3 [Xanthomonadaceae bacterium]
MSFGVFSGVVTAVLIVIFIGGWIWAWSAKRKPDFDAAARLPLDDDASPASAFNQREGQS